MAEFAGQHVAKQGPLLSVLLLLDDGLLSLGVLLHEDIDLLLSMGSGVGRKLVWVELAVFALPEKINMAVTEIDLDPKGRKMFITS